MSRINFIEKGDWNGIDYEFVISTTKKVKDYKKIVSCVLFTVYNANNIRSHPHEKYLKGLQKILKVCSKFLKGFKVRIYTDKITFPSLKPFLEDELLEVYVYNFPQFLNKDGYHFGYFGTLIRYLPFFDIEKGIKVVIISDLDIDWIKHKTAGVVKECFSNRSDFIFNNRCQYQFTTRGGIITKLSPFKRGMISSYLFCRRCNIPINIFSDYLHLLLNRSNKGYEKYINSIKNSRKYKNTKSDLWFTYGIDEYFLNIPFANYLKEMDYTVSVVILAANHGFEVELRNWVTSLLEEGNWDETIVKVIRELLKEGYKGTAIHDYNKNMSNKEVLELFVIITNFIAPLERWISKLSKYSDKELRMDSMIYKCMIEINNLNEKGKKFIKVS